ncbi:hypothetical protein JCM8097_000230 [Rhodosporidiobolus ruineniae]
MSLPVLSYSAPTALEPTSSVSSSEHSFIGAMSKKNDAAWSFADSVVSPALFLRCELAPSSLSSSATADIVFLDSRTDRPLYATQHCRRRGALSGTRADSFHPWAGDSVDLECRLFRLSPPSSASHDAHHAAPPTLLGTVTDEALLPPNGAGRAIPWERFYKRSWYSEKERDGAWKGREGGKYRWRTEVVRKEVEQFKLVDEKTKEILAMAQLVSSNLSGLVVSGTVLTSIDLVLLTLLQRTMVAQATRREKARGDWMDEEGQAW